MITDDQHDEQTEFPIVINLKEKTEEQDDEEDLQFDSPKLANYNNDDSDELLSSDKGLQDEEDEAFYLANKTFYITCHKISQQNSPSYRKRPPYTFLENWLIHSVFSKSQQILLRFPVIHPKVMITEGDFIYTPHQIAAEAAAHEESSRNQNYMQQSSVGYDYDYKYGDEDDEEEDYDYYDDTIIIGDEGVLVMTASAPDASELHTSTTSSYTMDENTWMSHSRYNSTGLTLHVVNPDEEPTKEIEKPVLHQLNSLNHIEETMPFKFSGNSHGNNSFQNQLQVVEEEEEEEEEEEIEQELGIVGMVQNTETDKKMKEETQRLTISPEVINWYRSAEPQSIAINTLMLIGDHNENSTTSSATQTLLLASQNKMCEQKQCQHTVQYFDEKPTIIHHHSSSSSSESYQSLVDIMVNDEDKDSQTYKNTVHSAPSSSSYGTLLPYRSIPNDENGQNNAVQIEEHQYRVLLSPLMQISEYLVDAAWLALDLARSYYENCDEKKSIIGFIFCMFKIWKLLFFAVETMLRLGNTHHSMTQAVV
ncbi:MAG: hypothetical protein EXX96DRAFT_472955 [Benjaminiella poitrasii]|nr:MAG: hypothetical protein EXX96DRAFT_472955 [Benjaminiella poitrasii]